MSNKILVIDGNNNLYRAFFKLQKLTSEGKSVSAIYGVTEIVAGLIKKFYPKEVYVVWDGKKRQERIDLLPEYKKREKKPDTDYDDMFRQRNVIQQMLMFLGVNQVYSKDMEADDYIYRLTRILLRRNDRNKIIIVSRDKDFNQLIASRVQVWDWAGNLMLTKYNLRTFRGYKPHQTVDYLTLVGDKSDNIVGYPGIGEVKASAFLDIFDSINEFLEKPTNSYSIIDRDKLRELQQLNAKLISLKLFWNLYLRGKVKFRYYMKKKNPKIKPKKFKKLCRLYGLKKFQQPEFINLFKDLQHERTSTNKS